MTIAEIYAIPTDGDGWRLLPNGKKVRFGAGINWSSANIDARVGNYATVGDDATVGNGATVGDDARVGNGAVFAKSPLAIQGTRHLACQSAPGVISIGCQTHAFEHWTEHVLGIARQNGYSDAEGIEYQNIVAFIVANGIPA